MDELDHKLLAELQAEPRKSSARLAKSLGITESMVRRRIEHLISSINLVFTALPDMRKFGYLTSAYIAIRTNQPSKFSVIAEQLCQLPSLRFVCSCDGFADFFVRGDFLSNESLASFITCDLGKIDGISNVDNIILLNQVKRTFGYAENRDENQTRASQKVNVGIDDIDRHLIFELQKNSRAPLKQLAQQLDISKPTAYRRIKKLVNSNIIRLAALPDFRKMGYQTESFFGIEAKLSDVDSITKSIAMHPQVGFVGICSGPTQIITGIFATSPEAASYLATRELARKEGVIRINWIINFNVLKRTYSWLQQ